MWMMFSRSNKQGTRIMLIENQLLEAETTTREGYKYSKIVVMLTNFKTDCPQGNIRIHLHL